MICVSGSYLHGRARSNEKTMGEEARRRERNTLKKFHCLLPTTPLPLFSGSTSFSAFAPLYLLLYQPLKKRNKKNRQLRRLGKEGFGRFGVNNSVVAGVPFPPLLARRILPSPGLVPMVLSYRRDGKERTLITSETPPPPPPHAG